jgi:hypothetical protein
MRIPVDPDHPIRSIPITHSGKSRSSIRVILIIPGRLTPTDCL